MAKHPRPFDVDDLSTMSVVEMVSAGDPIHDGQVNRAWRAMVQVPGSLEPAVSVALKYLPSSVKLSVELACSLAGIALKLPVPRGMLVIAAASDLKGLPTNAVRLAGRDEVLCYGSFLRWPEAARVRTGDPSVDDYLWQRFCASAAAIPAAAWDELVANGDRHAGNFIFDSAKYWLIDHDLALRPLAEAVVRMLETEFRNAVVDHREQRNQVATQLLARNGDSAELLLQPRILESRMTALRAVAERMPHWKSTTSEVNDVLQVAEVVLRGIILRLPALALHLNDRVASPGSSLQWTTSTKPLF